MRSLCFSVLFITGGLMGSSVNAEPPNWRTVDVTPLDVAGVKLGMGYEQVTAVIATHFQLSSNGIKLVKESTIYSYSRIAKSKQPSSLIYRKDGTMLEVSFSIRIPFNPSNPVAVSRVHYGVPNTTENVAMLKDASLAKYG